jgi:uncharacterized protein (UPF0332 family)
MTGPKTPPDFDPHDFLRLAARLAQSSEEAEPRSAISRAYYAVFLKARENLRATGVALTNTGRDHGLVVRALRARGGPEGNQLDRLRVQRGRVDYNLNARIQQAQALQVIEIAQRLWARL